jgi:hypothetical protein
LIRISLTRIYICSVFGPPVRNPQLWTSLMPFDKLPIEALGMIVLKRDYSDLKTADGEARCSSTNLYLIRVRANSDSGSRDSAGTLFYQPRELIQLETSTFRSGDSAGFCCTIKPTGPPLKPRVQAITALSTSDAQKVLYLTQ